MTQQKAPPTTTTPGPTTRARLFFVDNLRVVLTVLVVLHHAALTYSNIPLWYYTEPAQDPSGHVLDLFIMLNQTFFMGMFFLLAGYFVPGAADRRGRHGFTRERLVRLGVPLLLFVVLLRPWPRRPGTRRCWPPSPTCRTGCSTCSRPTPGRCGSPRSCW